MNNLFIFITILLLTTVVCLSQPISNNGITITSFQVSNKYLNISSPVRPSTTFTFGIQSANLSDIIQGRLYVVGAYDDIKFYPNGNFFNQTDNSAIVTICAPVLNLEDCRIGGDLQTECQYEISFTVASSKKDIIFTSQQLLNSFPSNNLYVVQNNLPPVLNSFEIHVNSEGPLVTMVFDIEIFGSGLDTLSLKVLTPNGEKAKLKTLEDIATSNGLYYIEFLAEPEVYGYQYSVDDIFISDNQENKLLLTASEIIEKFGSNTFNLSKSGSNSTIYTNLYSYLPNNASQTIYANQYTLWTYTINIVDYRVPILRASSGLSFCTTYYQNSTQIILYCNIEPNRVSVHEQISFASLISYLYEEAEIGYTYTNLNTKDPIILNISYSVENINELEPFYIETNYTFNTFGSNLKYLTPKLNDYDLSDVTLKNIVSGNLSSGVVSSSWLLDSYFIQLTNYSTSITDSKDYYSDQQFQGPVTIPRFVSNDMTIKVKAVNNIFDFTNNSLVVLPFIIETSTELNDNLLSSGFVFGYAYHDILSGPTNYYVDDEILLFTNQTNSLYQTWAGIYANSFEDHGFFAGDFNLGLKYKTNGGDEGDYFMTSQCFTMIPPVAQPTLITNFQIFPSNGGSMGGNENSVIINTTEIDYINIQFQTKGTIVDSASILFYQTEDSEELQDLNTFSCVPSTAYDYSTLISNFTCVIPVQTKPSQTLFPYIQASINGADVYFYNYLIQEAGFSSSIQLNGPSDNGLVPKIVDFETSFNSSTNTITVSYNIENPGNFQASVIDFNLFNRDQPLIYYKLTINQITIKRFLLSDTIDIELCEYINVGDINVQADWTNLGIYISIPSPISGVNYQFPYELLVNMDPNSQEFNIDMTKCDFSGPRLVEFEILDNIEIFDTTSQSYNVTLQFIITDDLVGFNFLSGEIKSNSTGNANLWSTFTLNANNLVSGNLNNGIYQYNLTIPQYSNATYLIGITEIVDRRGNSRAFTHQNVKLLSNGPAYIVASSEITDPNLPTLMSIVNNYQNNQNDITVQIQGKASLVALSLSYFFEPDYTFTKISDTEFNLILSSDMPTGIYYFNICITSESLSTICYSSERLQELGFTNTLFIYSPILGM